MAAGEIRTHAQLARTNHRRTLNRNAAILKRKTALDNSVNRCRVRIPFAANFSDNHELIYA